jgi:hypothetical protein
MDTPPPSQTPVTPTAASKPVSKRWILYVLLAGLLLVAGCNMVVGLIMSTVTEKAVEMGTGLDIDQKNGTMTFQKGDDSVTFATGDGDAAVELPDGFPEDFPLPDDLNIDTSTSMAMEGNQVYILGFDTQESVRDLAAFYKQELTARGWTSAMETTDGGNMFLMMQNGTKADGSPESSLTLQMGNHGEPGITNVSLMLGMPTR